MQENRSRPQELFHRRRGPLCNAFTPVLHAPPTDTSMWMTRCLPPSLLLAAYFGQLVGDGAGFRWACPARDGGVSQLLTHPCTREQRNDRFLVGLAMRSAGVNGSNGNSKEHEVATNHARLAGKTALVTGAGRGIGRAVALRLADAGAAVAVLSRSARDLEQSAELIGARGGVALVLQADLADLADHGALGGVVLKVAEELGGPDILINNAGSVSPLGASDQADPQEWVTAIDINIIAVARLTFLTLPFMREQRWGRIMNLSSGIVADPGARPGMNAYATSKAAVEAHTVNLAAELIGTGITVNAFRPGSVDTAMQRWIREQDPDKIGAGLHDRFVQAQPTAIDPDVAAKALIAHLHRDKTGQIFDIAVKL